jgi:hypothetical protein
MPKRATTGLVKDGWVPGKPKITRQGSSGNTKYSATSRNSKGKRYRGQGR